MRQFELWLDESGDFENDAKKTARSDSPSLVGGLLIENHSFPSSYIQTILPEDGTYHSVEQHDQLDRFRLIEDRLFRGHENRIVIFSNEERIQILNNNLTYLNVITEGILQLIKMLKAWYGEVHLHVVIANRVNTTTGLNAAQSVVPTDEYIMRLRERLLINGLEEAITENEWELENQSARKDKRLMLSDIICNTIFTRKRSKKFNAQERAYIEEIYADSDKTWIFTVLESVMEKLFRHNLMENRIGEAVAEICLSGDTRMLERCFSTLAANYLACGIHDIRFHYQFIVAYIEYYINVVREFDLCIRLLNNLLQFYIPILSGADKRSSILAEHLELDIKFYLVTVYTHKGDIREANVLIAECESLVAALPASMDTIDYRLRFETRRIVNLINSFDYEEALACVDKQVERCREIKDLMSLIANEENTYYDEFAKALGTRVQIKMYLLRKNPELYASAAEDSDQAINAFTAEDDKRRQYSYRVQLETEHRDWDEALRYLRLSLGLPYDADVKMIWRAAVKEGSFAVSAYVRLMAEAPDMWTHAGEMYKAVTNSEYLSDLNSHVSHYHPMEIVLWKLGMYYAQHGQIKAALRYYDAASEICKSDTDMTLNIIGAGTEFERYGIAMKEQTEDAAAYGCRLQKRLADLRQSCNQDILDSVFGKVNWESKNPEYYYALGRRITY